MRRFPATLTTPFVLVFALTAAAQDSSTAVIRGTVADATGARLAGATVSAQLVATSFTRTVKADSHGAFALSFLPPGDYSVRAEAPQMAPEVRTGVHAEIGATVELGFVLRVGGANETVNVSGETNAVETQPSGLSTVIGQREIAEVPLNGRRWQDLALHAPGVTEDPRGLMVDGVDNNNSFFGQARGRYRAPYQVLQRGGAGVPRVLEYVWRGVRTLEWRGDQRGHQVRDQPTARQRDLLHALQPVRGA